MEREGEKKEAQEHTSVISVFAPWWEVGEEVKSRKRNSQRQKQKFEAALIQPSLRQREEMCLHSPGTPTPPSAGGSPTSADPDRGEEHREASDVHSFDLQSLKYSQVTPYRPCN